MTREIISTFATFQIGSIIRGRKVERVYFLQKRPFLFGFCGERSVIRNLVNLFSPSKRFPVKFLKSCRIEYTRCIKHIRICAASICPAVLPYERIERGIFLWFSPDVATLLSAAHKFIILFLSFSTEIFVLLEYRLHNISRKCTIRPCSFFL